jgi:hypothetical protein
MKLKIWTISKIAISVFWFTNIFAQDVVTRTDGSKVYGKIIKEDSTNIYISTYIKSKKYDTFINKNKVLEVYYDQKFSYDTILPPRENMLSIHEGFWSTKYYQNAERINRDMFFNKLSQNPLALEQYKKGSGSKILAGVFGFASGYLIGRQLTGKFDGRQFAIGGILFISGVFIDAGGNRKRKRALDIYNSGLPFTK